MNYMKELCGNTAAVLLHCSKIFPFMIQSLYQYETEVVTIEYITEAQLAKELREKYIKIHRKA